jgi:hypothetical protein
MLRLKATVFVAARLINLTISTSNSYQVGCALVQIPAGNRTIMQNGEAAQFVRAFEGLDVVVAEWHVGSDFVAVQGCDSGTRGKEASHFLQFKDQIFIKSREAKGCTRCQLFKSKSRLSHGFIVVGQCRPDEDHWKKDQQPAPQHFTGNFYAV